MPLINPAIVKRSGARRIDNEGCLSVPGYRGAIMRSERVTVKALNLHGREFRIRAEDNLLAQALEHEVDHVNGILYVDRLDSMDDLLKLEGDTWLPAVDGDRLQHGRSRLMELFLPLLFVVVAFYLILLRPVLNQQRRRRSDLSGLEVGDEVLTSGGFYGVVRAIRTQDDGPQEILIEVAPGVELRATPDAIQTVTRPASARVEAPDEPDPA